MFALLNTRVHIVRVWQHDGSPLHKFCGDEIFIANVRKKKMQFLFMVIRGILKCILSMGFSLLQFWIPVLLVASIKQHFFFFWMRII